MAPVSDGAAKAPAPDEKPAPGALTLWDCGALMSMLATQLADEHDPRARRAVIVKALAAKRQEALAAIEATLQANPRDARPITRAYADLTDAVVTRAPRRAISTAYSPGPQVMSSTRAPGARSNLRHSQSTSRNISDR